MFYWNSELISFYYSILEEAQSQGFTNPAIAGGAIRDMLLNKPIKDIDIFYTEKTPSISYNSFYPSKFEDMKSANYTQYVDGCLLEYTAFNSSLNREIQFVRTNDSIANTVAKFPLNISKVYLTLDGLTMTSDFIHGSSSKILMFSEQVKDNYKYKIKNKYKDWISMVEDF